MKKILSIIALFLVYFTTVSGQAPEAIPYQAVARDVNGNLIASQNISLRFTIHDATVTGTVVYQETQSTTTTPLGLFSLNIGQGLVASGTFTGIPWGTNTKFIQVEMDVTGGIAYVDMGTNEMLSVPYALYAASSGSGGSGTVNGSENYIGKFSPGGTTIGNSQIFDNGTTVGIGTLSTGARLEVISTSLSTTIRGINGAIDGVGVAGASSSGANAYGVYGESTSGYAGYFSGKVRITDKLGINALPTYPLNFENVVGDKVSFFGSSGPHYGIGIQGGLMQLYTPIPASDIAFGTGQSSSMVTNVIFKGNGKVGIGTTSPDQKLTLDNDGGIVAKGTFNAGASLTTAGPGTRLMWYPKKGAFRCGTVNNFQWDDNFIGPNSFASGENSRAGGANAVAFGSSNAADDFTVALGENAYAYQYGSIAIGGGANATGLESMAIGLGTTANAEYAYAIGVGTTASGVRSTAMGEFASTNAHEGAFVIGDFSTLNLVNSPADNSFTTRFAGGYNFYNDAATTATSGMFLTGGNLGIGTNIPGEKLEVAGNATSTGSIAGFRFADRTLGYGNSWQWYASGGIARLYDHINNADRMVIDNGGKVGIGTPSPEFKFSLDNDGGIIAKGTSGSGAVLTTSGTGERMIWYPRKAAFRVGSLDGNCATCWDDANIGLNSYASGSDTKASGDNAMATGSLSIASGNDATAMGGGSVASGNTSTAIGLLTLASGFVSNAYGANTRASGDYSTAMGNYANTNGFTGSFCIGDHSSAATFINSGANNSFSARFDGGYKLYSNSVLTSGVTLASGGGSWTSVSDRNKKENFSPISSEEILQKVSSLPLTNWNYKSQPSTQRHIGCMAQDFYAAFHLDGESDTTINSLDIDGINMAAIQALKIRTDELKKVTDELLEAKSELSAIKAALIKKGIMDSGNGTSASVTPNK